MVVKKGLTKPKITSILLLAWICLAGIAVLAIAQPAVNITSWYPLDENITNAGGASRTFNITINQPVNVSWLINGSLLQTNTSVTNATYTNTSSVPGYWNVTAYAYNENGSDMRTWWWTVNLTANDTSLPTVIDWTPTPIVISGKVTKNGTRVLSPDVRITNLDTGENFTVKTHPDSCYYRMWTDSTHISAGDMLRFSAIGGEIVVERNVTETEIKNGGFQQNLPPGVPDLVISDKSETFINRKKDFTVSYWVRNTGDEIANASNTTIYVDGVPIWNDPVGPLAPGEQYNNTVGPFERPYDRKNITIRVCADSDGAVTESIESNNCLENVLELPLPNLRLCYYGRCKVKGPDDNGRFSVHYYVTTEGRDYVPASNTTINITNVLVNGSATNISLVRECDAIVGDGTFDEDVGPFTCACNKEVVVEICVDSDNRILETNEDNCWKYSFNCPASADKPDLEIVDYSGVWLDRTNRTFNVTYTVKNIGNAVANASTTRISNTGFCCKPPEVKNDSVPALEPGATHTGTVGPFTRLCRRTGGGEHPVLENDPPHSSEIIIHVNYHNTTSESTYKNNERTFLFGLPHLYIADCTAHWVDGRNKTFRVEYRVTNALDAGAPSNWSTVYAYIDGNLSNVTDKVPPLSLGKYDRWWADRWGIGPLQMPLDKETVKYKLCVVQEDGTEKCTDPVQFGGAACIGKTQRFTVGGAWGLVSEKTMLFITESCKFDGDIYAPGGIRIRANDIVIDGNGYGICGDRGARFGCGGGVIYDDELGRYLYNGKSGILNYDTSSERGHYFRGYDNVTIKNMNIRNFCDGIAIITADNCRVENCSVHDNGLEDKYTYGINVVNSDHTTIDNCSVYNNTGNLTGLNVAGGHGINFHDDCNYCAVTNSHIYHNYLSGILASPTCKHLYIGNNLIEENGYCNESGFCAGINMHWRGGFGLTTNSTVENNVIVNNTGSGIYVAQGYTAIKNNTVRGSKKNDSDLNVNGYGILIDGGRVTFLHNNTCCENEGADIVNQGFATFGDDNTCDVTDNYNDEGTRGCNFYCGGENGACIGDVTGTVFRCGDVVTESCTFNRSMSCRGCSGDGLIAGADNITIDGAGYALTGNFSGIGILCNHSGVKIKNLQVEDFSTGMEIENTRGVLIENCTVRTNLLTGINFSADNGTVRNSRIYDNFGPGIFVGGANSVFENNTVAKNRNGTLPGYPGYGIYFSPNAKGNSLTTNFIGDNEYYDIYNKDGASNYNLSDNNTCDIAFNYWDASMLKDKKYNCTYPWTMPDLIISNKYEEWVDEKNATYSVTYTIENIGAPKSRPAERSTTYLYIWGAHAANDEVGPLKPGENYTSTFGYTPTMLRDKDRIKVCADGADEVEENNPANKFYYKDDEWYSVGDLFEDKEANNCLENTFYKSGAQEGREPEPGVACVCNDGWCDNVGREYYKCGDAVLESCTFKKCAAFKGSMSCTDSTKPGLRIRRDNIVIEGNGHVMKGAIGETDVTCHSGESTPAIHSGIRNPGYDNVVIRNLEIWNFCTGIALKGKRGDPVENNVVENCKIHHNGQYEGSTHGIHMVCVKDTTIRNNDIHHNRGTGTSCGGGGNGIFLLADHIPNANNEIVDNDLHDNDRAGFWTKEGMNGCTIKNNRIWGNSIGSGLGDMTGGLVLQCVQSDNNTIEGNEVWANHGRCGIFIGGDNNDLINNNVYDNKGDGINMGRCDGGSAKNHLKENTVCGNEGLDIRTCGEEYDNDGYGNYCDTTKDYKDDNAAEGCKCWQPCSNVSKPDLKVTEKFETWVVEGASYNVTYTVKNVGKADAPHSTTLIQIVNGVHKYDSVPPLPPNESYTNEVGPFNMSGENETITVCADYEGIVEKHGLGSRDNNCMENTWWALPDLTVTEIEVPDKLSLLKSNTVTATIKNIGTVRTEEAFTVALFVDGSVIPTDTVEVSDLAANGIEFVDLTWKPLIEKDYTLTVVVDWVSDNPEGAIHESREDNNEDTITITEKTVDYEPPPGPGVPGGGRPPAGEENITGYEPGLGEGGGARSVGEGKEAPINETNKTVSGGETKKKSGYEFGPKGLEILVENVKAVAPVFLIIMVVIFVVLFYSGYFGEKRAHRRKNKNNRRKDKAQK